MDFSELYSNLNTKTLSRALLPNILTSTQIQKWPLIVPSPTGDIVKLDMLGADPTGSIDVSEHILELQAAGKKVWIGNYAKYRISKQLLFTVPNTGIIGDGSASLLMDGADGVFDNTSTAADSLRGVHGSMIRSTGVSNLTFANFSVHPINFPVDAARNVSAFNLSGSTNLSMSAVIVNNLGKGTGAILLDDCLGVLAFICVYGVPLASSIGYDTSSLGIDINGTTGSSIVLLSSLFHDFSYLDSGYSTFSPHTASAISLGAVTDASMLYQNRIIGHEVGILNQASSSMFIQNMLTSNGTGIRTTNGAHDNLMVENNISASDIAFMLSNGISNSSNTAGNEFYFNEVGRMKAGGAAFHLEAGAGTAHCQNNKMEQNIVSPYSSDGVCLRSLVPSAKVHDNSARDNVLRQAYSETQKIQNAGGGFDNLSN